MGIFEKWECYSCLKPLRAKQLTQLNFKCDSSFATIATIGRVLLCKKCCDNQSSIEKAIHRYVKAMGGTVQGNIKVLSKMPYKGD